MEEKRADNKVIETKQKINKIDDNLDSEKKKIKNLSDMQDSVNSINRNMDRCIELLSKSIKGPTTQNIFDDMHNTNRKFLINASQNIEDETTIARKNINELYKEKDRIIKESRNNSRKEENNNKE